MKIAEVLEKTMRSIRHGYEKCNEIMDEVPLLKQKRNKTVAWICFAFIVVVAICRMCGGSSGGTFAEIARFNFDGAPLGADTPEAVVMQYYKAYKDGDPIAYLNCVNYTDEEKRCIIGPLSEKMSDPNWRTCAANAYARIKYECEELHPYDAEVGCEWATANAFVEASAEWEGSSSSAGRRWDMKKIGDKWFVNKDSGGSALWMGLTSLSNPDPTKPSN